MSTRKMKLTDKLLSMLIVGLSIFLALNTAFFVGMFIEEITYDYAVSESSLLYSIDDKDFSYVYDRSSSLTQDELAQSETLSECYYVGQYFNASVLYHAYAAQGDARADFFDTKRVEYAPLMGVLRYNEEIIDDLFIAE